MINFFFFNFLTGISIKLLVLVVNVFLWENILLAKKLMFCTTHPQTQKLCWCVYFKFGSQLHKIDASPVYTICRSLFLGRWKMETYQAYRTSQINVNFDWIKELTSKWWFAIIKCEVACVKQCWCVSRVDLAFP